MDIMSEEQKAKLFKGRTFMNVVDSLVRKAANERRVGNPDAIAEILFNSLSIRERESLREKLDASLLHERKESQGESESAINWDSATPEQHRVEADFLRIKAAFLQKMAA